MNLKQQFHHRHHVVVVMILIGRMHVVVVIIIILKILLQRLITTDPFVDKELMRVDGSKHDVVQQMKLNAQGRRGIGRIVILFGIISSSQGCIAGVAATRRRRRRSWRCHGDNNLIVVG